MEIIRQLVIKYPHVAMVRGSATSHTESKTSFFFISQK
jgi:hypothetical protein